MKTFDDLFNEAQKTDSYWTQETILKFTNQLYRLLKKKDISKKQFADKLGTSQAYITKVLRGDANFTIETMVKLTRALDGGLEIQIIPQEENVAWYRVIRGGDGKRRRPEQVGLWAITDHSETNSNPLKENSNEYAIAS